MLRTCNPGVSESVRLGARQIAKHQCHFLITAKCDLCVKCADQLLNQIPHRRTPSFVEKESHMKHNPAGA